MDRHQFWGRLSEDLGKSEGSIFDLLNSNSNKEVVYVNPPGWAGYITKDMNNDAILQGVWLYKDDIEELISETVNQIKNRLIVL